mmetsp:Transcript_106442/g.318138  ORF Transcript_106442/g.318138 Transcript_106442/m.318138 type:complete len:302 (-) Transcript_106442:625-1530(-)
MHFLCSAGTLSPTALRLFFAPTWGSRGVAFEMSSGEGPLSALLTAFCASGGASASPSFLLASSSISCSNSSKARTAGRMCKRQAGMTRRARRSARMSFVIVWGMNVTAEVKSAAALSKAFSQEKPMSTAMALMTAAQALSIADPFFSMSSILPSMKIRPNATDVTKRATVISCIIPPYLRKKWAATNHCELKNTAQAKSMAMMFFSCGSSRSLSLGSVVGYLMIRTTSMTTKSKPAVHSNHTWRSVWPAATSSGSCPSALGSVPPMSSLKAWITMKEAARPVTSFSVSAASASQFFSHSSI